MRTWTSWRTCRPERRVWHLAVLFALTKVYCAYGGAPWICLAAEARTHSHLRLSLVHSHCRMQAPKASRVALGEKRCVIMNCSIKHAIVMKRQKRTILLYVNTAGHVDDLRAARGSQKGMRRTHGTFTRSYKSCNTSRQCDTVADLNLRVKGRCYGMEIKLLRKRWGTSSPLRSSFTQASTQLCHQVLK